MSMVELAHTIAPGCDIKVTGIRPGEKLHECLVSTDEARHAVALDDMFVITPEHPFWDTTRAQTGTALPDGFEFSSDSNDRWLTADELLGLAAAA
jgi:UDP-N-acetylglucosamine 4,6-dehydratase